MSYEASLNAEINSILDNLASENQPWIARWIAHDICKRHSEVLDESEDSDFWRHCGYEKTRDAVRRLINVRAGDKEEADPNQLKLPGYEHLQAYYMVRRDGEDIGVPIGDMTDPELMGKANKYRRMAVSCFEHANELDRFRAQRLSTPNTERPAA